MAPLTDVLFRLHNKIADLEAALRVKEDQLQKQCNAEQVVEHLRGIITDPTISVGRRVKAAALVLSMFEKVE